MMKLRCWVLLSFAWGWASAAPAADCGTHGASQQICGLQSPEDLELMPGGKKILISEMVGETGSPGKFAVLDLATDALTAIKLERAGHEDWGDPRCRWRPAAELSPHGFHLSRLVDGRLLMLAVNHGKNESVQAYSVSERRGRVRFAWRGCVDTEYNFNDVAATPDGFIGSHQYDKPRGEGANAADFLFGGANTGFAVRWSKAAGFRRIGGTEAAFPNGITVSTDGKTAWMAATAGRQIRKIDLLRNVQLLSADLPIAPDNLSWTADQQLLVTGADDIHLLVHCADAKPPCNVPFSVVRIDPNTLKSQVIYRHDGSLLLGASVALIVDGSLYLGSFTGNHILRVAAP